MKMLNPLKSNKGSALFEIVAAMAILLFVLAGMMVSITYARYKTLSNYHDRIVTLLVDGELQKIRHHYDFYNHSFGSLNPVTYEINDVFGVTGNKPIKVRIHFTSEQHSDNGAAVGAGYISINAIGEWTEVRPLDVRVTQNNEKRSITLREDYHYKNN